MENPLSAFPGAADGSAAPPGSWVPRPDLHAVRGPRETVLLDGAGGRYLKLNPTGALIWDGLVAGKSEAEMLAELTARFPAAGPRLRTDLENLLEQLRQRRLIVPAGCIAEPSPSQPDGAWAEEKAASAALSAVPGRGFRRLYRLLLAYVALLLADLALRAGGYPRFSRLIRSWPVSRRSRPRDAAAVCAEVDAAARFYFRRAWCLQRSAVAACLLRRGGRPARLVVGVHEVPFGAHAWVELGGEVVNDDPRVRRYYQEIERL